MTVGELKKLLSKCNDSDLLVMSSDGEGNSHSPLDDISSEYLYLAESSYSGNLSYRDIDKALEFEGYDKEDHEELLEEAEEVHNAVVLFPIN